MLLEQKCLELHETGHGEVGLLFPTRKHTNPMGESALAPCFWGHLVRLAWSCCGRMWGAQLAGWSAFQASLQGRRSPALGGAAGACSGVVLDKIKKPRSNNSILKGATGNVGTPKFRDRISLTEGSLLCNVRQKSRWSAWSRAERI